MTQIIRAIKISTNAMKCKKKKKIQKIQKKNDKQKFSEKGKYFFLEYFINIKRF